MRSPTAAWETWQSFCKEENLEVSGWVCGSEALKKQRLMVVIDGRQEIVWAFTFLLQAPGLQGPFLSRWWNPLAMTFKGMASKWASDKPAAALSALRCPWAWLQVSRRWGPVIAAQSCSLWAVKAKAMKAFSTQLLCVKLSATRGLCCALLWHHKTHFAMGKLRS